MKKTLLALFACAICVIGFQAFTTHHQPEFQNLKILPQDISEHDLDSVMKHFCISLGVRCNFCHVRDDQAKKMDFVSDNKPEKNIARKMMLMSIMLNKNYFKWNGGDHDHDMKPGDHDMNMKPGDNDHDHDMKPGDNGGMMPPMMMDVKIDTTKSPDDYKMMLNTITCYTCHRGTEHPDSKAPNMPPPPPPPPPPAPAPTNGGK